MMLRLVETCSACPEQYDVFLGTQLVGYMRLRHGYFYAEHDGKIVLECPTVGDGRFADEGERRKVLNAACAAILRELVLPRENDLFEIDRSQS